DVDHRIEKCVAGRRERAMSGLKHLQVGHEHHHLDDARRLEVLAHARSSEVAGAVHHRERRLSRAPVEEPGRSGGRARPRIGRGPPSSVWRTRTLSRVCPGPRGLASSATSGSTYTGSTRLIAGGAPSLTTRRRALRVGRSPAKEKPPSGPVMARATVAKLLEGYGSLWSASVAPLIARPSTLRLPLTLSVAPIVSSTGLADASSSTACGAEAAPLGASAASARANETAAVA